MKRVKNFSSKRHGIVKRILSLMIALAMVLTMGQALPGSLMTVKAENGSTNIKIYFQNTVGYTTPAIQFWKDGGTTNTTATGYSSDSTGATEISNWDGATGYILQSEGNDMYSITLTGDFDGLQFLDMEEDSTKDATNPHRQMSAYDSNMANYTDTTATDLYYLSNNGTYAWYTDSTGTTRLTQFSAEPPFLLVGNLPGIGWDQTADPNFVQQTDSTTYSVTLNNIPAGAYEYKVLQNAATNGWDKPWGPDGNNRSYNLTAPANLTFSVDSTDSTMGVTITPQYIQDITCDLPAQILKGNSAELPTTGTYYDGQGNSTADTSLSIAVAAGQTGASISGSTLSLDADYTGSTVTVTVTAGSFSKNFDIPVVDKVYNFTINYFNPDAPDADVNGPDVYFWNQDGSENQTITFTGTYEDSDNGVTWLTTDSVELSYNNLGIIGRLTAGTWDGGQDGNQYATLTDENTTLWYVYGKGIYTEKPEVKAAEARYVIMEYDRADGNYDGWSLYTWNSGFGAEVTVDFENVNGKGIATVPIASSVSSLSFCVKQTVGTDEWANKDGGDHMIDTPLDQTVIKAQMTEGSEPALQYPYNTGYEIDVDNNCVWFYYRDDAKYLDGTLESLGDVKVEVDGTEHSMTYDASTQRYVYQHTGLTEGEHTYRYVVGGENILDKFNANKNASGDYSVYAYYKYDAKVAASLQSSTINARENDVLTLSVTGDALDGMEITDAYVDASALGLSSKYSIDTELLAVSLSVVDTIAEGQKTLPVTVEDQYGNKYTTSVNITVTAQSTDSFDWDEAIIYFMVTDRFFDGNSSNNAANGEDTYGTNEGLYHGGDFAGVTQKLDYLKDLGVNTIWITPIVDNIAGVTVTGDGKDDVPYNASYHGYWAQDFTKLDPALGTEEEFETLISEAHERGMKIMVDVVVNHAGYGTEKSDQFTGMLRDSITYDGTYILGDGQSDLPDFLTENAEVRNKVIQWQVDWMTNFDIDYFRVDTVKHVDNTTWAAFKNALTEQNPEFKMIGEYYGAGYASTFDNLGTGTMDSLLDFDFNNMATDFVNGKIDSVESYFESRNSAINNTATMGGFLSSHDEDGFLYSLEQAGDDEDTAKAKAMVAASLQLTAKGQPVIYYGEELGQSGANDYPYQTNRYDYDWSIANDSNSMYVHYKKMLQIRNDNTEVFAKGTRTKLAGSDADEYLAFERTYGDDRIVTALNVSDTAKSVKITTNYPIGTVLNDLYGGGTYTVASDKTVSVTIPAAQDGGTVVLAKEATPETTPDATPDAASDALTGNGWVKNSDGTYSFYDENGVLVRDGWVMGTDGEVRYVDENGIMVTNQFKCDGTYTYFLQNDGSPMKDRLTYHTNGEDIIYFDEYGHEVFDNFAKITRSIAGEEVDDICYFDTFGHMYIDQLTYDRAGEKLYYINAYGVLQENGWFQFSNGNIGYAKADASLMTDQFSFDQWDRLVYFQSDGTLAKGLITDGIFYYNMDETDGHCLGFFW